MNKQNDRVIRAIVACGSFVALIVIGYPLVDEGLRLREDHRALSELEKDFEQSQSRDVRLHRIESKLQEQKLQLVKQCVTQSRIPVVRDELITMIRDCGGSLRALEIEDEQKRSWGTEDDDPRSRRSPDFGTESEFNLHSHEVSLSVVGPLEAVLEIVRVVDDHHWLLNINTLTLEPVAGGDSVLSLEMNMTLFGLMHAPAGMEDAFAMID
ncbi:hypothetical protein [Rhodopirellula sallentina]|uniref:Uncharacterized protein n=1 Tax=Rhodopirellula sallentina SM41 TaxID=1263870 RepID=M5UB10_9BACT|nr:hypothetical protein [Rhodopirellula sallentina]EMI53178.1 hypothetical protein RSSM_05392 [Rhodopirellula sallentina SM41]